MLSDLFQHTLGSAFGMFYSAAYALSVTGSEEERRKNKNYHTLGNLRIPSKKLSFTDYTPINSKLELHIEEDSDILNENDLNDNIYIGAERDIQYSELIKKSRFKDESASDTLQQEEVNKEMFVVSDNYIYFYLVMIYL
jgi:hypothetical protein